MIFIAGIGLGTALGAIGKIFGGFGARKRARAAAKAAELNAQQILARAETETVLREREGIREAGAIRAAAGASGLEGGGSAADILRESARNLAFDVASIREQADLQARALRQQAKAGRRAGNLAFAGGFLDAATLIFQNRG